MPELPTADRPDRPLLAVSLAVVTVFLFASGDILLKYLSLRYPVPIVSSVRYALSLGLLLVMFGPRLRGALWRTQRPVLLVLRGLTLSGIALVMGLALRVMPVGETVAIMFLAPVLVMAMAVPILGEKVSGVGWVLAAIGFAGVLLIVRPGAALDPTGVVMALMLAVLMTVFHLLTRFLTRSESALVMLFYVTLVGTVSFGLAALPYLGQPGAMPTLTHLGLMALMGLVYTVGHFIFARAYSMAPASVVAPVNYMHVVWAALLGWLVFGHIPDGWTILGMAMILGTGVALAAVAHRGRAEPPK